jgi:hypothetical protein
LPDYVPPSPPPPKKNFTTCEENPSNNLVTDTRSQKYRPMDIAATYCIRLEKLMYNRLISYIEAFNILTFEQYGFRKNKSTNTAVQS